MSELHTILNQLSELGFVMNPPASQKGLDALQASFGELDDSILELYRHHNGMSEIRSKLELFDMHLMPIEEALEFKQMMDTFYANHYRHLAPIIETVRFLWQDYNSNAMGVYVSGELKGMIFVLDHEDTDLSPRFSSYSTMYQYWISCTKFNIENKEAIAEDDKEPLWAVFHWSYPEPEATEYPRTKASEDDEKELKISLNYIEKANLEENERTRLQYLLIALNLIPFGETQRLIPFLDDADSFVQNRAFEILALRKYAWSVDLLAKVILNGQFHGQALAIDILSELKTEESEKKLLELIDKVTNNDWKRRIVSRLKFSYGYEFKQLDENYYAYRKSPNDEWTES